MSISFTIDIEKVSRSKLIMDTLISFFGSDNKAAAIATLLTKGPDKAMQSIRKATEPTHIIYDAIIDTVTTQGCRDLNKRRWKIGDPAVVWTPRHWNCRAQNRYVRLAQ